MLEKFLVLLERFVVAHELIAKQSGGVALESAVVGDKEPEEKPKRAPRGKAAAAKKTDDEPEEKPKRAPRGKAAGGGKKDIRAEVTELAKSVIDGDSEDCIDDFDDLLEEFDAKTVKDVADEDIDDFFKELKDIVGKYYE